MKTIKALISKVIRFIKTDVWRISLKNLPGPQSFFIKQIRIVLLVIRGFDEDKCMLRASALTFYSLLSIVPVAAMAFGIAKGFGFEKLLEEQLLGKFPGQEEVLMQVVGFAHSLLENTKGGLIAGIGIALLFWAVIKVLSHIESSFNEIWEIKESRPFGRKFSDYLSIMLICPVLVIISGSATVFITTQVILITEKVSLLGIFSPLIFFVLKVLPYCLIWVLLTVTYLLMPYTKVNFTSGLSAGIVAGTIYQIAQLGYINSQVFIAKYNAIYGSFAALPLFLIWLQLSWLIVLFGAEISFAHQNVDTYEFEPDCLKIKPFFKTLLTLQIAHLLTKNFSKGEKPLTAHDISHALEVPIRLVNQILYELVESGLFSDTNTDEYKELAYQPARDINLFTIQYILEALEERGVDDIPVARTRELNSLSEALQKFRDASNKSPANRRLKEI
jgi:membrane protein